MIEWYCIPTNKGPYNYSVENYILDNTEYLMGQKTR